MLSLVTPTYNERQNIARLVERAAKALATTGEEFELIVVDDASPDGTAEAVRGEQRAREWLKLVVRENERDLSTAVLAGWAAARGELLGCMDSDLQHPPEVLPHLFERLRATSADIVIASRYVEHGSVSEWKLRRRIISWTATKMAYLLLPERIRRVRDPMSGFFLMRRSVLAGASLRPRGYKILLEILAQGSYQRVEEVPYMFEERAAGGSKIGARQVCQYLLQLFRIAKGSRGG